MNYIILNTIANDNTTYRVFPSRALVITCYLLLSLLIIQKSHLCKVACMWRVMKLRGSCKRERALLLFSLYSVIVASSMHVKE